MTLGSDFSENCSTILFCLKDNSCFPSAQKFHIIARAQEEVYTYTYTQISFHIKFFLIRLVSIDRQIILDRDYLIMPH